LTRWSSTLAPSISQCLSICLTACSNLAPRLAWKGSSFYKTWYSMNLLKFVSILQFCLKLGSTKENFITKAFLDVCFT
jgi:hypothetical protein